MRKTLRIACVFIVVLLVSPSHANATARKFSTVSNENKSGQIGVGFQIGSLTGFSFQYWLSGVDAVNAALTAIDGDVVLNGAKIWLFPEVFHSQPRVGNFVPYLGAGALVLFGSGSGYLTRNSGAAAFAGQLPIGCEFLPRRQRFDVFAEILPGLEITPVANVFVNADIGARFYF